MATKKTTSDSQEIVIKPLTRGTVKLRILGSTAMFQNRMANKAKQQLLIGGSKKGAADRAKIKHSPLEEYRDSAEQLPSGPTALGLRVVAVKAAMCSAAIETEGVTKTGAQRLIFMPGDLTPLYGIPQLRMDVTRSADINRTPDIRTRCFLPKWGAEIEVSFVSPQLSVNSVVNLLVNAGILIGVGDFRQEKGKGAFGSFTVLGEGDQSDEWDELVATGGRMAQLAALQNPEYANEDTADLMAHFFSEQKRRAA